MSAIGIFMCVCLICSIGVHAQQESTPFYVDSIAGYSIQLPVGHSWKADTMATIPDSVKQIPFMDDVSNMLRICSFNDTLSGEHVSIIMIHMPIFSEDIVRSMRRTQQDEKRKDAGVKGLREYDTTIASYKAEALEWIEATFSDDTTLTRLHRAFYFHAGNRVFQIETTVPTTLGDLSEQPPILLSSLHIFTPKNTGEGTVAKFIGTIKKVVLYGAIAVVSLIALVIGIVLWRRHQKSQQVM